MATIMRAECGIDAAGSFMRLLAVRASSEALTAEHRSSSLNLGGDGTLTHTMEGAQ
jgi:hypothetical protein